MDGNYLHSGAGGGGGQTLNEIPFCSLEPFLKVSRSSSLVLLLRCNCHFYYCHLNMHIEDSSTYGVSLLRNKICGICYSADKALPCLLRFSSAVVKAGSVHHIKSIHTIQFSDLYFWLMTTHCLLLLMLCFHIHRIIKISMTLMSRRGLTNFLGSNLMVLCARSNN